MMSATGTRECSLTSALRARLLAYLGSRMGETRGVAVVVGREVVVGEALSAYLTAIQEYAKVQWSTPRTTKGTTVPKDDEGEERGS